jgi:hypothetical protein
VRRCFSAAFVFRLAFSVLVVAPWTARKKKDRETKAAEKHRRTSKELCQNGSLIAEQEFLAAGVTR